MVHLNSQGRVKIARDAYINLIDRLVARLGRGAIMRLVPKEFWQPEAAQSFEFPDPDQLFLESDKRVKWLCSLNRKTTPPRPIRLLAHPQPVDVIVLSEEYRPIRFIWQRRAHKVVHSTGPERIAPAWWKAPKGTRTRDYFWLRDDQGAGFWLYCEGLTERNEIPVWFLHGFFA